MPEKYVNVLEWFKDVPFDLLNPVLEDFRERGLISELNSRRVAIWLILHLRAVEFLESGGFAAENSLKELDKAKLELEVRKLQLEVADLEGLPVEKANRLTSIAANIAALFGVFQNS